MPTAIEPDTFAALAAAASAAVVIWLLPRDDTLTSPAAVISAEPETSVTASFSVTEIAPTTAAPKELAWVKMVDWVTAFDDSVTAPAVDVIELVPSITVVARDDVMATPMLNGNKVPNCPQPLFDMSVWMVESLATVTSLAAVMLTPFKFTVATALRISVLITTPSAMPGLPCKAVAVIVTLSVWALPMVLPLSIVMMALVELLKLA